MTMLPAYSKFCSIIRTPVYAVFRSFGLSHNYALHELLLFCQCLRQNGVHHFLLTQLSASEPESSWYTKQQQHNLWKQHKSHAVWLSTL